MITPAHRFSPSAAKLLEQCSWWLSDDAEIVPQEASPQMALGTEVHGLLEAWGRSLGGDLSLGSAYVQAAEAASEEAKARWCLLLPMVERELPSTAQFETKLAWDYRTGVSRILLSREPRDYADRREGEICGTVDVLVPPGTESAAQVIDLKTGRDHPPAHEHRPLDIYALMVAGLYATSVVSSSILHAPEGKTPWMTSTTHTADRLAETWSWIVARLDAGRRADPPTPGPWCRDCPARASCPAIRNVAQSVPVDRLVQKFPLALVPSSPDHAAWLLDVALGALEAYAKALRRGLEAYADEHDGIRTNGDIWRKAWVETETPILTPEAMGALKSLGLDSLVEPTLTWRACGKRADDVREVLRKLGALRVTKYAKYERKRA